MIVTVTLQCDRRDCTTTITTSWTEDSFNVCFERLLTHATRGGWHLRPVATPTGDDMHAYCPTCTERLLTLAANTLET